MTLDSAEVAPDPSHADRRRERGRRLKLSIFSGLLTKPLAVITPIITVPLFLRYLGAEGYGLYESIGALAIWLGLTNAGLTLGLINRLTDCHVNGDRILARRYVSSIFYLMLPVGFVGTILITILIPLINWQLVFPTDAAIAGREIAWGVWIAAAITLWGVCFSIPQPIYMAYQEIHRSNLWDGASKAAALLASIAVVRTSWGLIGVIAAGAGAAFAVRIVNIAVLFIREKPWLLPRLRFFDPHLLRISAKQGVGLFIISSATLLIFQGDKLIIGHFLGGSAVAQYTVVARPFLLVFGLYAMLVSSLWPAHGEALRRGDLQWVLRALWISVVLGAAAILLCGGAMFFLGDQILRLWTRGEFVEPDRSLVVAMTALFLLWMWISSLSIVLNAAGILRAQIWFILAHALLNFVVAISVVDRYGSTGVAWSLVATGLLTTFWGYLWVLYRNVIMAERFSVATRSLEGMQARRTRA